MNTPNAPAPVFLGRSLSVRWLEGDFVELCLDRKDESTNKLDRQTVQELGQAVTRMAGLDRLRGVLVTSAKDVFVVGADIN